MLVFGFSIFMNSNPTRDLSDCSQVLIGFYISTSASHLFPLVSICSMKLCDSKIPWLIPKSKIPAAGSCKKDAENHRKSLELEAVFRPKIIGKSPANSSQNTASMFQRFSVFSSRKRPVIIELSYIDHRYHNYRAYNSHYTALPYH